MDDPINFITAEEYYRRAKGWTGPTRIDSLSQETPATAAQPEYWHGVTLTFNDETLCVVQFVRPTLFRIRYDPAVGNREEYDDANSRTIIEDYMSQLVHDLDAFAGITWITKLKESADRKYWIFSSTVTEALEREGREQYYKTGDGMKLFLHKDPFRIQAVRVLTPLPDLYPIPEAPSTASRATEKIVWQTSPETFRWSIHPVVSVVKQVVLDVIKAGHGEFIGFGEQGGTSFMKTPTFMNYFNFDNMQYQQVYSKGPLDAREPLYHSDPFYMDVNSNPEHANVTASFLDNYSHIAIDFGFTNSGFIKLGTRFNGMDIYVVSADTVPEITRLYTSIIGRPKLKPKYVLGHHQACYGYEKVADLYAVLDQYRSGGIPLDGLHIDVDFQDGFRTFTTNPTTFPDPKGMFTRLRENGIKCSTNITPVISIHDRAGGYSTLREGLEKGYFIKDKRYLDGTSRRAEDVLYVCYGGGSRYTVDPKDVNIRPDFGDNYDFVANWNVKDYPYHGGVSYGYGNGTAGYYPDLNRKEVREWWGKQYHYLYDMGLEFVWQDMTTPAIHTSYGDMKGLPSRLLMSSDAVSSAEPTEKTATEIWALYSYNLHKATAQGLATLEESLPSRKNKRNFILGRGSFAGMYRYAGLWSGDNASTWEFWKITVSQVLSVGLNGVSVSGADMGGFEPYTNPSTGQEEKYCNPELLIRWYAGSFLLPWFRNHYVKKTRKWFQEPYAYPKHLAQHPELEPEQGWLYRAVQGICKYYVELRYSLIQVLYDAMFDNQLNGLPIARSMLLTDTQDTSFFNESQRFLDDQYVVRKDILVAPIIKGRHENPGQNRDVYLPLMYFWYPSNLRPWDNQGIALSSRVEGGSVINYTARITNEYSEYPFVTPVYLREGAIIPQVGVRQWIGDLRDGPNRMKINIYPGRDNEYITYLDDGVSRSSAPDDLLQYEIIAAVTAARKGVDVEVLDPEAKGEYRSVSISQTTTQPISTSSTRTVTIAPVHSNYNPAAELGEKYTVILWYDPGVDVSPLRISVGPAAGLQYDIFKNTTLRTVVIDVKETIGNSSKIVISVSP
ncbi:glycosyl hydrolases family 31-domain-containing protein [Tuber indicum]|nr:glycosyl hydrolases family 31-domain-containing protein [Tuber indicum]